MPNNVSQIKETIQDLEKGVGAPISFPYPLDIQFDLAKSDLSEEEKAALGERIKEHLRKIWQAGVPLYTYSKRWEFVQHPDHSLVEIWQVARVSFTLNFQKNGNALATFHQIASTFNDIDSVIKMMGLCHGKKTMPKHFNEVDISKNGLWGVDHNWISLFNYDDPLVALFLRPERYVYVDNGIQAPCENIYAAPLAIYEELPSVYDIVDGQIFHRRRYVYCRPRQYQDLCQLLEVENLTVYLRGVLLGGMLDYLSNHKEKARSYAFFSGMNDEEIENKIQSLCKQVKQNIIGSNEEAKPHSPRNKHGLHHTKLLSQSNPLLRNIFGNANYDVRGEEYSYWKYIKYLAGYYFWSHLWKREREYQKQLEDEKSYYYYEDNLEDYQRSNYFMLLGFALLMFVTIDFQYGLWIFYTACGFSLVDARFWLGLLWITYCSLGIYVAQVIGILMVPVLTVFQLFFAPMESFRHWFLEKRDMNSFGDDSDNAREYLHFFSHGGLVDYMITFVELMVVFYAVMLSPSWVGPTLISLFPLLIAPFMMKDHYSENVSIVIGAFQFSYLLLGLSSVPKRAITSLSMATLPLIFFYTFTMVVYHLLSFTKRYHFGDSYVDPVPAEGILIKASKGVINAGMEVLGVKRSETLQL